MFSAKYKGLIYYTYLIRIFILLFWRLPLSWIALIVLLILRVIFYKLHQVVITSSLQILFFLKTSCDNTNLKRNHCWYVILKFSKICRFLFFSNHPWRPLCNLKWQIISESLFLKDYLQFHCFIHLNLFLYTLNFCSEVV